MATALPQLANAPQREMPSSDDSQAPHNVTPGPQFQKATYVVANANPEDQQQQHKQQKLQAQERERSLSPEEIDRAISLGKKFLAQGDVATARRFLARAAEARDPRAALMLAATYDPEGLRTLGVVGMSPDLEQAHSWYALAAQFEASQRLAALAQPAR
jgi:TPR repeat protein